ncbi:UDP-2,3-diacetamido-2,3-dideoxy-D-glucuronate 2-epimerase [Sedimentisphaera salicampi]|uniref:UDP-2,3-diacetamido-2,3-dideoxy-D-glucuronate 2-epimerase n=2 Tax=Sedimentisphaera salicampi TaxID=1941349 RepID=A0A1W6LKH0_9BACT|nr:UDP-2,3-diacetamido-2,3-dideoxy-D-glucuronate 2-epimerase [Sedimentisphaera salicampi]
MKIAPIMREFDKCSEIESLLVHTGQHYDEKMSDLFFNELGIPEPDINLGVGSGSHAVQTAEVMKRFEPVVQDFKPDYVLVVGDVNSTIACGLVAVKLGVKLIHVEAGLRSGDRSMPEEINRVLTDSISDLLFVTEQSGIDNLKKEGIPAEKVHFVGNVMIDTLLANREKAEQSAVLNDLGVQPKGYGVITLHRPSNVDNRDDFRKIIEAFREIEKDMPLIFPIHPRTRKNIKEMGFADVISECGNIRLIDPVGYLDFMKLISNAAIVITDSGGIQEETTILQVPCMTLRENTERPVTVAEGTNRLVHIDTSDILENYNQLKADNFNVSGKIPKYWDGKAAERIAGILSGAPVYV